MHILPEIWIITYPSARACGETAENDDVIHFPELVALWVD